MNTATLCKVDWESKGVYINFCSSSSPALQSHWGEEQRGNPEAELLQSDPGENQILCRHGGWA